LHGHAINQSTCHQQISNLEPKTTTPKKQIKAAAVANHVDVATLLLQEAGRNARALARATNRYGHSALSIAARKNCAAMMALLATAAA
jgi:hypothetical protein